MQGTFYVWDADHAPDRAAWLTLWHQWPQREVQAHPAYTQLFAHGPGAFPRCAAWVSSEACILYPFILRDLTQEPYWTPDLGPVVDLISPYGFGGPYIWPTPAAPGAAAGFWAAFDAWAQRQHVVSEFVRLSLFPAQRPAYPGVQVEQGLNIVRSLDVPEAELWRDMAHKVRKNVRRAQLAGVEVEIDPEGTRQAAFVELYHRTMDRRQADGRYYFPARFFTQLRTTLYPHFCYFHALHEGQLVSSELVLVSQLYLYSFLGGTHAEAFSLRPNDLLKYEIMRWGAAAGKQGYVLGGGYRNEDGIYRYKRSFAPHGIYPFFSGRRILHPGAYNALSPHTQRGAPDPSELTAGFFPSYRNPALRKEGPQHSN